MFDAGFFAQGKAHNERMTARTYVRNGVSEAVQRRVV